MPIKSKFQKISKENNENLNAVALVANPGSVDLSQFTRRNLPQMVKPGEIPVGGVVTAEIIAVVDSPVSTVKGKLLHLRNEAGKEFTFPATGTIRNALAPGKTEDGDELQKALEKFVGKLIVLERAEDKMSAKYKKTMFMFNVYTN